MDATELAGGGADMPAATEPRHEQRGPAARVAPGVAALALMTAACGGEEGGAGGNPGSGAGTGDAPVA